MFTLSTLGPTELRASDGTLLPLRKKELVLLAYLARAPGRPWSRAELATLAWGDRDESKARQSLRQALSELRDAIGAALEITNETVTLLPDMVAFDVAAFEAAGDSGSLERAAELWQGDFLARVDEAIPEAGRAWLDGERAGLRRRLGWTYDKLVRQARSQGDGRAALAWSERWARDLPEDESAATAQLESLALAGRAAEALGRHAAFRERHLAELGIEPSPRFLALAAQLAASDAPPAAVGVRGLLTPDLIDRAEPFEALVAGWRRARSGGGAVILVEGEPGLGKSRLVADFARLVRSEPTRSLVLEARAFETERADEYRALSQLLGPLVEAPGVGAAPPELLASAVRVLPSLKERFPSLAAASPVPPVRDAILRIVTEVAAEVPVLAVLDDAAFADQASLAVITQLVRRPPPRLLVVLTGRHADIGGSVLGAELRQSLPHSSQIGLRPLGPEPLGELAATMAPIDPTTRVSLGEWLWRQTAGVPGSARQLIEQLADRGVLSLGPSGRWVLNGDLATLSLPVVTNDRELMLLRLERLGPDARALVEAASVVGPEIEGRLLERIGGLEPARFQNAATELLTHRLLREPAAGPGRFTFSSEPNRRAVYAQLAPSRRQALHRSIAEGLAALPSPSEHQAAELARHRAAAGISPPNARRRRLVAAVAGVGLPAAVALGLFIDRFGAASVAVGTEVLLTDIANQTGDSVLGGALFSAAFIGLQQSPHLALVPRDRVRQALARMKRPESDSGLTESVAREVAQRDNIPVVVALAVTRLDSTYLLTSRLIEPASGRDIWSGRAESVGRGGVLGALQDLLGRTRRALGETWDQLRAADDSLPQVTTSSLEALKLYADGRRAWSNSRWVATRDLWLRAIELDSTFAVAMVALAEYNFVIANDPDLGRQWLARAGRHSARLTEREQLRLRIVAETFQGNPDRAIALERMMTEQYPSRATWGSLGQRLLRNQRCNEAIPALRTALSYDSTYTAAHINLATCYQVLNQPESALAGYRRAERLDSASVMVLWLNHEYGRAFVQAGMDAEAERLFLRKAAEGDPTERAKGYRSLAMLAAYHGRFRQAAALLDSALITIVGRRIWIGELRNRLLLAEIYQILEQPEAARGQIKVALRIADSISVDAGFLLYLGRAAVRDGQLATAEKVLARLSASANRQATADLASEGLLKAEIALARGRAAEALEILRGIQPTTGPVFHLALRGRGLEMLGRIDSALTTARELAAGFHWGGEDQTTWLLSQLAVARLAEQRGDTAVARSALMGLVARWKNGDPDLPPLVTARRDLVRLQTDVPR